MNLVQIDNWRDYQRDGEQFLRTAVQAHAKGRRAFSTDTLYNLTCMAIEKYIMAFLMKNGDLAENHTIGDLLYALDRHCGDLGDLAEELRFLDTFQEICDLENYTVRIPSQDDINRILTIGESVKNFLEPHLKDTVTC